MATITDNDLKMFQERAKTELASGCDVGGIAWDSVIWDLCNKVRRLRGASKERGDCAKLREFAQLVSHMNDDGYWNGSASICALVSKADAALAAPPRNCDRFQTKEDAAMAFNKERSVFIPQSILWQLGEWLDWLFAPATEGENNGNA